MKRLTTILLFVVLPLVGFQAHAQPAANTDKQTARAERKAEGSDAARNFYPGEGNPIPDAKPKTSRSDRAAARGARKSAGVIAAKTFVPGEGNPKLVATARLPREERRAERAERRAEIKQANKAGTIPSYGEGAGGTNTK